MIGCFNCLISANFFFLSSKISSYFSLKPSSIFWKSYLFLRIYLSLSDSSLPIFSLCWLRERICLMDCSISAFCLARSYYLILWLSSSACWYFSLALSAISFFFCSIFFISSLNSFRHSSLFSPERDRFSCRLDLLRKYSYFSKEVSEFSM